MLARRYRNDHRAIVRLNALQTRMRDAVERKVRSGEYALEDVVCAVCGGSDFEPLAEKDRYGLALSVAICRACGLIQTNPRMNGEACARFYDAEYRKLYVGEDAPAEEFFAKQVRAGGRIAGFVEQAAGGTLRGKFVFEVGCGAGGILKAFAARGAEVKGCDPGSEYVAYGREVHGLDLEVGTLFTCALPRAPDLIVYSHVLEHVLDVNGELRRVRDALAPGGNVYVEIPSVKNIRVAYRWDFLELLQNAHTYHFTLATLSNLMGRNGFRLVAGNERVESLFAAAEPDGSIRSDYAAVMEFLRETERRRWRARYLNRRGAVESLRDVLGWLGRGGG